MQNLMDALSLQHVWLLVPVIMVQAFGVLAPWPVVGQRWLNGLTMVPSSIAAVLYMSTEELSVASFVYVFFFFFVLLINPFPALKVSVLHTASSC